MDKLNEFIKFCKKLQPQTQEDVKRFFEGVVFFPYDDELLLQAFLFLNINSYFPLCTDLLLFEKSPNGENTDQGKCDFVYLTRNNKIVLIETKYIDTESRGDTERKRRNDHRNHVFKQVNKLRQSFSEIWSISNKLFHPCVFTTEDLSSRSEANTVEAKHISIKELKKWQEKAKSALKSQINIQSETVLNENSDPDLDEMDIMDKIWMTYYMCEVCFDAELCTANKMCYFDITGGD